MNNTSAPFIVIGLAALCCLLVFGCASMQARLDKMNFHFLEGGSTLEPQVTAATIMIEQKRNDKGEWGPSMSLMPGTASAPKDGLIYVLIDIQLENLPGRAVVITSDDVTLNDDAGGEWKCKFWNGTSWTGTIVKASKSILEITGEAMPISMPVPEAASRETGLLSFIPAGSIELTTPLKGDVIRVLFELPREKSKTLKLFFQSRFITDMSIE